MLTELTDKEFIIYICGVLWNEVDGNYHLNDEEHKLVDIELGKRHIDHLDLDFMTKIYTK
jgi:hypothetical protein